MKKKNEKFYIKGLVAERLDLIQRYNYAVKNIKDKKDSYIFYEKLAKNIFGVNYVDDLKKLGIKSGDNFGK